MDAFLDRQDERVAYSRQQMEVARKELLRQVFGNTNPADATDPDVVVVKAEKLPLHELGLKDLVCFMLVALNRRDVWFVILSFLSVSLLGMLTPYVTKLFLDEMIPSGQDNLLLPLGCLLVSATVSTMLFSITRSLVIIRVRDKMNIRLNAGLIDRIYHLPASFFRERTSGDLGQRIMNIGQVMSRFSEQCITISVSLIFALVYFYQITLYASALLGVSLVSLILQMTLMSVFLWLAQKEHNSIRRVKNKLSGMLYNLIGGIRRIKSSGAEERVFAQWARLYVGSLKDRAGRNAFLVYYPALTALVSVGTVIFTYYYTLKGQISLSDYAAYTAAFGMVSVAITALSNMLPELTQLKPSLDLCRPILQTIPEVSQEDAAKPKFLTGRIDINGLKFRYGTSQDYVLNDFNLHIEPGEYVGIVGKSGCGKSTLVRLLLGMEKAEAGSIFYDSYNLNTVDLPTLRQRIGTCLQDSKLFGGNIFSNITVTAPLSTQDDVWEAVRLACLDQDIKAMGMGLHTIISEGGGGISGGQRQRVLIARALVGKPSILILDEATSALDNLTQKQVSENLNHLQCTRICIAHRLSTIRNCSRIIVLDMGKVAEEGTFKELMARKGLFYELVQHQMT